MRTQLARDSTAEAAAPGSVAGAWKWEIRKKIWDYMEANDIARCGHLLRAAANVNNMLPTKRDWMGRDGMRWAGMSGQSCSPRPHSG